MGKSLLWWIGDWALFGERAYGQDVYQAFADCGYEDDTIRDGMRVCRAWPLEDRCPDLSYGHHRLLVTIPEEKRPQWIDDTAAIGQVSSILLVTGAAPAIGVAGSLRLATLLAIPFIVSIVFPAYYV